MIDTTGKCSACGQTVGIDTIHTCSPQVTAPTPERRVGEAEGPTVCGECGLSHPCACFTDAERGTGRVGEAWLLVPAEHATDMEHEPRKYGVAWKHEAIAQRAAVARLTAEVERLNVEVDFYRALQRTDNSQVIAALTAEVKRLTEEKAEAVAIAGKAVENLSCGSMGHTAYDLHGLGEPCPPIERLAARLAALSLPTPAPEATE